MVSSSTVEPAHRDQDQPEIADPVQQPEKGRLIDRGDHRDLRACRCGQFGDVVPDAAGGAGEQDAPASDVPGQAQHSQGGEPGERQRGSLDRGDGLRNRRE